jgi:hypothetical protein
MTIDVGGVAATHEELQGMRADLAVGMRLSAYDAHTHAYSGPITITAGGTYTGNWESLDPAVPAVTVSTSQPVTIINSRIRSRQNCIRHGADFVDLTVNNCSLESLNPGVVGQAHGHCISLWRPLRVEVTNCNFFRGGLLLQGGGFLTTPTALIVRRNRAFDITGLRSDGTTTGYQDEATFGQVPRQFLQIAQMVDIPNARVEWNQVVNRPGASRVEDSISVYASSGLPGDRMLIANNFIYGGFHQNPYSAGTVSMTGILAEFDASNVTVARSPRYITIEHNQVVAYSNLGISVQGNNNTIRYNHVVRSRQRMDGLVPYGDNGITIRGSSASAAVPGALGACAAERNHIYTENMAGNNNHSFIDSFQSAAGSTIANNVNGSWPTLAMEGEQWFAWIAKCEFHGVEIGSTLRM